MSRKALGLSLPGLESDIRLSNVRSEHIPKYISNMALSYCEMSTMIELSYQEAPSGDNHNDTDILQVRFLAVYWHDAAIYRALSASISAIFGGCETSHTTAMFPNVLHFLLLSNTNHLLKHIKMWSSSSLPSRSAVSMRLYKVSLRSKLTLSQCPPSPQQVTKAIMISNRSQSQSTS